MTWHHCIGAAILFCARSRGAIPPSVTPLRTVHVHDQQHSTDEECKRIIEIAHNDFPREALVEALLRFVEEDLSAPQN
jgi:hypothetical protein